MTDLYHEFTHRNHYKWGYNGQHFNKRQSERDKFSVSFGKCSREPYSFRDECFDVAIKIHEYAQIRGKPIDLMFSGGSESEIMVRSFIEQDIDVNIHIMQFDYNRNLHDIAHAVVFCEQRNIPFTLHELDLDNFTIKAAPLYANFSKCVTPRMLPHMWLMERLYDGIPVMGMGECYIAHRDIKQFYSLVDGNVVRNQKDDYPQAPWYFYEREKINSWYRFAMEKSLDAIPGFFQYTPEIMLAFLEETLTKELVSCMHYGKLSNTSTKLQIYEEHFPGILQRYKKDGFEYSLDLDKKLRTVFQKEYGMYSNEAKIEYNKLLESLRP